VRINVRGARLHLLPFIEQGALYGKFNIGRGLVGDNGNCSNIDPVGNAVIADTVAAGRWGVRNIDAATATEIRDARVNIFVCPSSGMGKSENVCTYAGVAGGTKYDTSGIPRPTTLGEVLPLATAPKVGTGADVALNFQKGTISKGALSAYVPMTGGDWSGRHTMAWAAKGTSNQMVFGEIAWANDLMTTAFDITLVGVKQLGAWYQGAVVIPSASVAAPTYVFSPCTKIVTAHDDVKANKGGNGLPHQIINGGKAAKARKDNLGLEAYKAFSNAGSWGSNHNGMVVAFGDGHVQMMTDTVAPNVICNLAAPDATVTTSL
jgi:hypothetical protein